MAKPSPDILAYRNFLGERFLKGSGLEIGAGPSPINIAPMAKVRYVDYMPIDKLRQSYPNLPADFVAPDIVDDGTTLSSVSDNSVNFITACHVLEHTEDPIQVLKTWLRKVRRDGIVLIAIPDKRFSFDKERPLTDFSHLEKDHKEGPEGSRIAHLREFARLAAKCPETEVEARVQDYLDRDYRIHYHVWEQESFLEHLLAFRSKYQSNIQIEHFGRNHTEIVTVLRLIN